MFTRPLVRLLPAGGLLLLLAAPLAAQDVAVKTMGSMLMFTGGDLPVEFSISTGPLTDDGDGGSSSGDAVTVTPAKGTTLNGSPDVLSFTDIKSLKITLGPDIDHLSFVDFTFGGTIKLKGGLGNDTVDFTNCTLGGTLKLNGDDGDDTFTFGTSTITGKLTIVGGTGILTMNATDTNFIDTSVTGGSSDDEVTWQGVSVKGKSRFTLKQGADTVSLTNVDIGLKTDVNLSSGANVFTATTCGFGDQLKLVGGNDPDNVTFTDSGIGLALKVTLGGGENNLSLNSVAGAMQVGEQLIVKGGSSTDTVTLAAGLDKGLVVQVGEFAKVSLSGDANTLTSTGVLQIGTDLKYSGGSDDDHVSLDGAGIGEDLTATLSGGNNEVTLNNCVGTNVKITAGSGDDTVAFTGTTAFSGKQTFKLGGGDNTEP